MGESALPMSFPCRYPLKVMGPNSSAFERDIVAIARRHVPDLSEHDIRRRTSSQGRYLALTLTFTAHSKAQLDGLYREITRHPDVGFVL